MTNSCPAAHQMATTRLWPTWWVAAAPGQNPPPVMRKVQTRPEVHRPTAGHGDRNCRPDRVTAPPVVTRTTATLAPWRSSALHPLLCPPLKATGVWVGEVTDRHSHLSTRYLKLPGRYTSLWSCLCIFPVFLFIGVHFKLSLLHPFIHSLSFHKDMFVTWTSFLSLPLLFFFPSLIIIQVHLFSITKTISVWFFLWFVHWSLSCNGFHTPLSNLCQHSYVERYV